MSKLLANQISNYTDNGPVEVKDGINVASGKPLQVAGVTGTSGDYLKSTGSSVAWTAFPTIPAAQVQSDWGAVSGMGQILNKPTLAAVATSGSYGDLINTPTITSPIQSDWNQSNSTLLDFIKNKPALFSGAYNDLTGKPTVPATLNDLADVNIASPVNDQYVKWDSGTNRWIQGTGSAGLLNIVEDTTPQLGGTLDANGNTIDMGNNIITDGKVTEWNTAYSWGNHASAGYLLTDNNTTYTQEVAQATGNVNLRLVDSGGTQDDILITAGSNITFSGVGSNGFTIDAAGGTTINGLNDVGDVTITTPGNGQVLKYNGSAWVNDTLSAAASVTSSDAAPGSPNAGDLWFKSDEGRLKVYYSDANSSQWVDTNPPLTPTTVTTGTSNGTNSITTTTSTSGANANAIEIKTDNNTASAVRWRFTPPGHLIPNVNAAYDIGNAEYKVRHLFLSDNTLYFEGDFLKVAQHNEVGTAQAPSYLIPLAKLKDALNASANYEAFKTAILAITDA